MRTNERKNITARVGVDIIRPEVRAIRSYRLPASPDAIRLHQNEAPDDWPKAIKREIADQLVSLPWHHYPSASRAAAVAEAIGLMQGTPAAMVAPTAGSIDALQAAFTAIAAGGVVVMPTPTFAVTKTLAIAAGARVVEVPLAPGFALDVDATLRAAHAHRAEAIYLAVPNNPTANAFDRPAVNAILEGAPGAVIIDEAYWEFTRFTHLDAVAQYSHLLLTRTFSKAMASAGLRIGWITAQASVIAEIVKVSPAYNLSIAAQVAAPILVSHREIAIGRVHAILTERARISAALGRLGMRVYPSETNFLLFEPGQHPADVWQRLAERGVLIRDVSSVPQLGACLRMSIGTPTDNDRFLAALAASVGRDA